MEFFHRLGKALFSLKPGKFTKKEKNMAIIADLIRVGEGDTLDFGNYVLAAKAKKDDFSFEGDLYKIKTFKEITKLERNGLFVYESVPGTAVHGFKRTEKGLSFQVFGESDVRITVELLESKDYTIFLNDANAGMMKTNLGGKLTINVELEPDRPATVEIREA